MIEMIDWQLSFGGGDRNGCCGADFAEVDFRQVKLFERAAHAIKRRLA
jgi:hypothetical protein